MSSASTTTLTLNETWSARAAGGIPSIPLAELQAPPDWPPGQAITLMNSERGAIALGIFDPANGVLRVTPAQEGESFDRAFFAGRVRRAAALREQLRLNEERSAFRLINGEGDDLSGFLVDVYAGHAVIYTYCSSFAPYVNLLGEALNQELALQSVVGKVRPAGETPTGKVPVTLLSQSEPPSRLEVDEAGVRYEVHLLGGINTGLFVDMREVRQALRPLVVGARVLNAFSYTGSFSVVSALAGAESVTSVDFASGVLQWSKTNFTLNGLDPGDKRFQFTRGDVFDFLKTGRRKGLSFDAIILDPPAVTTVPGRRWHLKSDYDRLIGHALQLLAPGGLLVVAANTQESRPDGIERHIRAAARDANRRLRLLHAFGLPPDFPTQLIYPQARYLKCFFLQAD